MKQFNANIKGQIFSADLIIAGLFFLLALSLSIIYSNSVAQNVSISENSSQREIAAITAASALVYSNGSPANWQNLPDLTGVVSLGIAKTRNEIDPAKLERIKQLAQSNYGEVKDLLGASKFGLKVTAISLQNSQIISEFGAAPPVGKDTSSVNRFALLNGQEVILRVQVFGQ